jgi:hypothetical protein
MGKSNPDTYEQKNELMAADEQSRQDGFRNLFVFKKG